MRDRGWVKGLNVDLNKEDIHTEDIVQLGEEGNVVIEGERNREYCGPKKKHTSGVGDNTNEMYEEIKNTNEEGFEEDTNLNNLDMIPKRKSNWKKRSRIGQLLYINEEGTSEQKRKRNPAGEEDNKRRIK